MFHQAGNSIKVPSAGITSGIGTWPSYLRNEHRMLKDAIHKARNNRLGGPLDVMLRRHGSLLLRMSKSSLNALRNSGYRTICRRTKPVLCHGDFGPTNIIRSKRGTYLIDFETMQLDLRVYDLYRLIFNTCQTCGWNFKIARAILDGYQERIKLSRADYVLLKALLRYPRGICKLIQFYDKRPRWIKRQIEQKFPIILSHERRRGSFLKKLDAYARAKLMLK